MSLDSTSSANQSDAVLFPYNRSLRSKETLFTGLPAHPSRALLLLLWGATNCPQAGDEFTLPTLPWEHKKKLQLYSMKNFFITMWNPYTKDELRDVYDTATGHRQPLAMLPVGFFPIVTADRFFSRCSLWHGSILRHLCEIKSKQWLVLTGLIYAVLWYHLSFSGRPPSPCFSAS